MKRLLKNIVLALLLVVTTFTGIPGVAVLAQEASNSAVTNTTTESTPKESTSSADVTNDDPASPSGEFLPAPTTTPPPINRVPGDDSDSPFAGKKASDLLSLDFDEPVIASAVVKQPVRIRSLIKHDYRPTESVTVTIDNVTRDTVDVMLFDTNDNEIDTSIILTENGESILANIQPPADVKPGKYVLQVVDSDDQVAEVSFTWGMLSFNTDKTVYRTGEKVSMYMGVTDEQGNIACKAKITVSVTDPDKKSTELSTEDDTITINSGCTDHGPSLQADYETGFIPVVPGMYEVTMKAVTTQGTYSLTDQLSVQTEDLPYIIQRSMPTRIFPIDPFTVTLNIKANKDFTGTIRDIAPGDFVLTPSSSSASLEQITNRVSSASAQRRGFSGYPIGQLRVPFEGDHGMSLDFGGTIQDPLLKDLYKNFGLLGHDGLDFAMPIGTPILSTDAGSVLWAGPGDYGNTVIIEHVWGRSYYGHLSEINVTVGQFVSKGAQIALSGNTGISTGPHLHFGIKPATNDTHNGYYGKIDPLPYLTISDNSQILTGKTSGDFQSVKIISWDVALKKDESVTLAYTMKAPERHPAVHLIGPVQFITKNEDGTQETMIQSDTKLWQVVADQAPVLGAQIAADAARTGGFDMQPIDPALFNVPEGYPLRIATFDSDVKGTMSVTRIDKEQVGTTFTVKDEAGIPHTARFTALNTLPHDTSKTNYTLSRKDIFPNVDMDYTTHDGYLQQILTIKSDQARREFAFDIEIDSEMVIEDLDAAGGHIVIKHKTTGEELMTLRFPQGIDNLSQRID
jgi:murein DD-endopeptidase MepM/ murein hydrolase activator NlpD